MNEVVIGIGSNIDPQSNIGRAVEMLSSEMEVVRQSPVVRTEPVGMHGCADFLNTAVLARTDKTVQDLKMFLKKTEQALGRPAKHDKYAPRTIDLDILVFNGQILDPDVKELSFLKNAVHQLLPEVI